MKNNFDLEELIYEFAHVSYKLGRYETDGKDSSKEYNKMDKRKEELKKIFDEYFSSEKASSKKYIKINGEQSC